MGGGVTLPVHGGRRRFFGAGAIAVAAAVLGLAGCAVRAPEPRAAVQVTILHTNDHHGRFWRNEAGEHGLAARRTLIEQVREEVRAQGGHVLLLDGGDVNTGVPESDLLGAEPDFRGMSLLGYSAMAVGNHEFDRSEDLLRRQQGAWSAFPWLSANIYRDGRRAFEPYRIFRLGSLRLAVLGLTTDDTAKFIDKSKFPQWEFRSPIREAGVLVPQLRKEADVVVALSHMGHYPDGRHGVNAPGDVELARAVNGIDVVVGGHSQTVVCMESDNVPQAGYRPGQHCRPDRQNGAWIVQAGDWGRYVGRIDAEYRDGAFRLLRYTLMPVNLRCGIAPCTKLVAEDAEALALLQPYQARGAVALGERVASTVGLFDGRREAVRWRPTTLGMLITASMAEKTGADLALVSSGGIRDSLPVGEVSYRDLLKAQPFGNRISLVTLNGAELAEYLKFAASRTPGSGAFPQLHGVRMVLDGGGVRAIEVGGRPLDPARTYRLAVNSYVAKGGDGYPLLSGHAGYVDTGFVDAQVLREYMAARGSVRADAYDASAVMLRPPETAR